MRTSSVLVCILAASTAAATATPGTLVTISAAVDVNNQAGWWNPLDEHGGYDWLAYLRNPPGGSTSNHNVMVVRRTQSDGAITRDCLKTADGECAEYGDDAGHSVPSVAVDGDGYVHVFTSMHNELWKYYRSTSPHSSSTIVNASAEMPDQTLQVTYPVVKRDANGDLWLMVRGQAAGDSTARGGYLYKYTTATQTWVRVDIFAYQTDYSVYPDDIQFTTDGDVHLQWEWCKYPASAVRHQGSYLRYTPLSSVYRVASGTGVALPVTPSTADLVYQPLTSGETYANDINHSPAPAFQSAKMSVTDGGVSGGTTYIQHAYRFQNETDGPWQIRWATTMFGTANPWTRTILYSDVSTSAGIGITYAGSTTRIYYCRASGSAYVLEKTSASAAWTNTVLAPTASDKVQRLQAIIRPDGTDVLYLGAPSNINSTTGSVYLLTVSGR